MQIRSYKETDKETVLKLLRLNTPYYFSPDEEKDLLNYLEKEREQYFVIELDGGVVGSGGINFADNHHTGKLSWDMLHPDVQGRKFGSTLVNHRLNLLKSTPGVNKIIVRTTQLVYPFYEKCGFITTATEKDYWAKGFDLYYMEYPVL